MSTVGPLLSQVSSYRGQALTSMQAVSSRHSASTVCFPSADGVMIAPIPTTTQTSDGNVTYQHWLPAGCDEARDVTAIAFHPKGTHIAIAERKRTCRVAVYTWPERRAVGHVDNGPALQVNAMCWNRSGTHFAVLGGAPSFALHVYKVLPNGGIAELARCDHNDHQFTHVSFNPKNQNELCTSGGGHITFWVLESTERGSSLHSVEGRVSEPAVRLTCHAWLAQGGVVAGSHDGRLYTFAPNTGLGTPSPAIDAETGARTLELFVTKYFVACADVDGVVTFLDLTASTSHLRVRAQPAVKVAAVMFTGHDTFVMGTDEGSIVALSLPGFSSPTPLSVEELRMLAPKSIVIEEGFGDVVAAVNLPKTDLVAGLASDGVLRVRNLATNHLESRVHVGEEPQAMMVASEGVLAIASATGTLRFVQASPVSVLSQLRISSDEEVARKAFKGCRMFAPMSNEGLPISRYALMTTDVALVLLDLKARSPVATIGVPASYESILDVCYLPNDPTSWVLSTRNSSVILCKLPPDGQLPSLSATDVALPEIPLEDLMVNRWRTELPFLRLSVLSVFDGVSLNLFGVSMDRETKFCQVDLSLALKRKDVDTKALKLPVSFTDHSKPCSYLNTIDAKLLVSCGTDGRVVVRNVVALSSQTPNLKGRKDDPSFAACRQCSYAGGVKSVSLNSRWLISVGGDGSVAAWNTRPMFAGEAAQKPPALLQLTTKSFKGPAPSKLVKQSEEELFFLKLRQIENERLEMERHAAHRAEVMARVEMLRERLRDVQEENKVAAEDERVDTVDFLVEREKARFETACEESIAEMKDEVKWHDLHADYVAHTLKKECWEPMQAKLTPLIGIKKTELRVYSCHERAQDPAKVALLRKLKFLRRVEECDREHRRVRELQDLVAAPAVKKGEEEPQEVQPASSSLVKMFTNLDEKLPPADQEVAEDVTPYLYDSKLAFTRSRAITQIFLLEARTTNLVRDFNVGFNELAAAKKNEVGKIKERNIRCTNVQKELEDNTVLFTAALSREENPNTLLEVLDEEVPADKAHDPTEKARRAVEEGERERWRRQHGNDDSSDRALKAWMDGRLEKEIKKLKVDVPMPEFAVEGNPKFVPLDERTDDQLRQLTEYEKLLKQRTEEVEARRKLLEAELKLLQKDNVEGANNFDNALQTLLLRRIETSQQIAQVELHCVKLAQAISLQRDRDVVLAKLERQRAQKSVQLVKADQAASAFRAVVDQRQQAYDALVAQEKAADKGLKSLDPFKDFEDHAEKLAKIYANAKKKAAVAKTGKGGKSEKDAARRKAEKGAAAAAAQAEAKVAADPDPFAFVDAQGEAKQRLQQEEAIQAASAYAKLEKPEALPDPLWAAFQQYLQDRVDGELAIKREFGELEALKEESRELDAKVRALREDFDARDEELRNFRRDARDEMYDTDMLRLYRQGQVEVAQAPVVTDYADAVLIHANDIRRLNGSIKERGAAKVQAMETLRKKKAGNRLLEWELDKYHYLCQTLEVECRHLHTLRVTKQMQEFIHGGGEGFNERERAKLHAKIEHVRASMSAKIEERKQLMTKVKRATKEKDMENMLLLEQVADAQSLVDSRRSVRDLQSSELERERHNKLMRDMRVTRKLEDVAKAQQEEMSALRKEIDRLRERTFPSFAVVSKRVIGNPDER